MNDWEKKRREEENRIRQKKQYQRKMRRRRMRFFTVLLLLVIGIWYAVSLQSGTDPDKMAVYSSLKKANAVSLNTENHVSAEKAESAYQNASLNLLESSLTAQGALVMKGDEVLYSRNADRILYPASMTKILTALVAIKEGDLDAVVTVPDMSEATCYSQGSMIAYLQQGDQMTLRDFIGVMMVYSANDAASAIAYHIGGSEEGFAEKVNAYAIELGAMSTHYTNPHGLHDENHYTCANDMMLFLKAAVNNEILLEIMQTPEYVCELIRDDAHLSFAFPTTSRYLNGDHSIEGFDYVAGKTGYTGPAGRCFASCFEKDGEYYYSVVMNSEDYVYATSLLYYYVSDPSAMRQILE